VDQPCRPPEKRPLACRRPGNSARSVKKKLIRPVTYGLTGICCEPVNIPGCSKCATCTHGGGESDAEAQVGARFVPARAARVVGRRGAMGAPDVCLPHPTGLFQRTTAHVTAEHGYRVKGLVLLLHGWLQSGFPRVTQRVHIRKHHPPAPLPHHTAYVRYRAAIRSGAKTRARPGRARTQAADSWVGSLNKARTQQSHVSRPDPRGAASPPLATESPNRGLLSLVPCRWCGGARYVPALPLSLDPFHSTPFRSLASPRTPCLAKRGNQATARTNSPFFFCPLLFLVLH
jgi:hypothetical protein